MLSIMVQRATLVGFYDTQGETTVEYCLNQTKMSTIFGTKEYLPKLTAMKQRGMAQYILNFVLFEGTSTEEETRAAEG